ncbi:MAG: hypothetical protein CR979_01000 [Propionibacterium sp.]|nr:MAG: hypothetical protein CR979_01000 [Propionibacterium sp.]
MLNATVAFAIANNFGCDLDIALAGLAEAQVPGRMQAIELIDGPLVVVDFAHTPQAISAVLSTFSATGADRRLIAVLGAGGDRDNDKRGPMGAAAGVADIVIVTDDNPRTESPGAIRAGVIAGLGNHPNVLEIADRKTAITTALKIALPGDIVTVLGKGHEQGQIIGDKIIPFDDAAVVRQEWATLREDSACSSSAPKN